MRHNPRFRPLKATAGLLLLCGLTAIGTEAFAQGDTAPQWRITFENDEWGDGSDGHYTHGTRISRLSQTPAVWVERAAARLPCAPCRSLTAVEWSFGQDLYTPESTWRSDRVDDDRPYAGWLFGGVRLLGGEQKRRAYRLDTLGLDIGVVGPAALAEQTQNAIHNVLSKPVSRGWDHQLEDEAGLILSYRRAWHHAKPAGRLSNDIAPYIAGALGNVFTHFSAGLSLKTGVNFRPHRLAEPTTGAGWHLFLDLETRAVARNIFLDGNTHAPSHRVEKEPVIAEVRSGISYTVGRFGLTLTTSIRSREFVGQREPDRYGAISFSYQP